MIRAWPDWVGGLSRGILRSRVAPGCRVPGLRNGGEPDAGQHFHRAGYPQGDDIGGAVVRGERGGKPATGERYCTGPIMSAWALCTGYREPGRSGYGHTPAHPAWLSARSATRGPDRAGCASPGWRPAGPAPRAVKAEAGLAGWCRVHRAATGNAPTHAARGSCSPQCAGGRRRSDSPRPALAGSVPQGR